MPKWCDLNALMNLFGCVNCMFTDCTFPVTKMHAIRTNQTLCEPVDYSDNNRSCNRTCKPKIVRKKRKKSVLCDFVHARAVLGLSGTQGPVRLRVWPFDCFVCLTPVFRETARQVLLGLEVRLRPNNTPQFYRFGSNEQVGPRGTQRVCWTLSGCYWD